MSSLVRVVGIGGALDSEQLLSLSYKEAELMIDISSLQPFKYLPGTVYQFIGEVKRGRGQEEGLRGGVWLKAHCYRMMEGLDMEMYHRVQNIRQNN